MSREEEYFPNPGPAQDRIARQLVSSIESALMRLGLLVRVFGRVKNERSLNQKLTRVPEKYAHGRRIQDLYGVRIALFFSDDIEIAKGVVRKLYEFDSESISEVASDSFGPNRCNLVFRLPDELKVQCPVIRRMPVVDATFEVQFRTVLSEGWHEVEHDLRYKRKDDWSSQPDLDRSLNGVVATLETCDWTMLQIFGELAWRSLKQADLSAMLYAKFRLRIIGPPVTGTPVGALLGANPELLRSLYRVERDVFLERILNMEGDIPLTEQNIVFVANRMLDRDTRLKELEPTPVRQVLEREFH